MELGAASATSRYFSETNISRSTSAHILRRIAVKTLPANYTVVRLRLMIMDTILNIDYNL